MKTLVSRNLIKDFGLQAQRMRKAVQALHQALAGLDPARAKRYLETWQSFYAAATDYGPWSNRLPARPAFRRFVRRLGLDADRAHPRDVIFVLHTYYAMVVKLLATRVATHFLGTTTDTLSTLGRAEGPSLRDAFAELESGAVFRACGIRNFLEADVFGWYPTAWTPSLARTFRDLAGCVSQYDPGTCDPTPGSSHDLLKNLYLNLLPREIRHDLGEYYTPDWLAEHLLEQTLSPADLGNPDTRTFDPACGTGTFLVLLVRHTVRRMKTRNLPRGETLTRILSNVVGADLNPLAVMAARANYLLALGDLLRARTQAIDIPVHLANSVLGSFEPRSKVHATGQRGDPGTPRAGAEAEARPPSPPTHLTQEFLAGHIALGSFHYVVGNPPWVNWESLPSDYRLQLKPLWVHFGLFPHGGMDMILGKGKKDIAMLMTFVAADRYLEQGGKLGFILPQNVFKTDGAGRGFRRFALPDGTPLGPVLVEDMVDIRPFGGTSNRTALAVFQKGRPVRYPVPYKLWKRHTTRGGRRAGGKRTDVGKGDLTPRAWFAEPVDPKDETAPWLTAPRHTRQALRKVLGPSTYSAHEGANTGGANGIYWVEVIHTRPDGLAEVHNLPSCGRRKVPGVRATIERDILYPLLRGRDVGRWQATPSAHVIMAQDPETRRGITWNTMRETFPGAQAYLATFETVLRSRAAFRRYFRDTTPYWSMFNVSRFTFSPWKVVWREQASRFTAAAIGPVDGRPVIPDHKLMMVAVDSCEEAWYLTAALNSAPATLAVAAYTIGIQVSTHVLRRVAVPRFSPDNPLHREMARLSRAAHDQARQGAETEVRRLEAHIDRCAAAIWRLTDSELGEIQRGLEEV